MGKLLYLVHRLPYPPNKGDKVRSFHLLKHLSQKHQVFLGTFIDDPADEAYLPNVKAICPDLHVARLHPRSAKVRSLAGLLTGQSLSECYYLHSELQQWVNTTLQQHRIDAIVVFSSVMAQFISSQHQGVPMLVDFVDVDSAKWAQYAPNHRWPLSWLYRREGQRLLAFERDVAARSMRSFFVTENETELFRSLAPECAPKVQAMSNGVDSDFFCPDASLPSPYTQDQALPLVFTGAMDYWPNIDAVTWFVSEVMPLLRPRWPHLSFYIVGRSPPPAVQALACADVVVTGTVADVRPYLQHAAVVVAPLRLARGIQNKILEAMAMARPVVASSACVQAIDAAPGTDLLAATTAQDFATQVGELLQDLPRAAALGSAGRQRVLAGYSWQAHLAHIDRYLGLP